MDGCRNELAVFFFVNGMRRIWNIAGEPDWCRLSGYSPLALGIVSGRINFRHQFPAGDWASGVRRTGRIVSRRLIGHAHARPSSQEAARLWSWKRSRTDDEIDAVVRCCSLRRVCDDVPYHGQYTVWTRRNDRCSRFSDCANLSQLRPHKLYTHYIYSYLLMLLTAIFVQQYIHDVCDYNKRHCSRQTAHCCRNCRCNDRRKCYGIVLKHFTNECRSLNVSKLAVVF